MLSSEDWQNFTDQVIDDKYHITEFLGAGSFAGVFRADYVVKDELINTIAVKLIPVQSSTSNDSLLNEAKIWLKLDHQSILKCYSVGSYYHDGNDYIYIVTELADNSLDKQIAFDLLTKEDVDFRRKNGHPHDIINKGC